jgi:hypothetical protein
MNRKRFGRKKPGYIRGTIPIFQEELRTTMEYLRIAGVPSEISTKYL